MQKKHSGKRSLQKLAKKGVGWNISKIKQGLPIQGIQEKGQGMPDFFYCFKRKADILSFSYIKTGTSLRLLYFFLRDYYPISVGGV